MAQNNFVPANSRPPASPEYVAVPGYMGEAPSLTDGQKKAAFGVAALAVGWFAWKKMKK